MAEEAVVRGKRVATPVGSGHLQAGTNWKNQLTLAFCSGIDLLRNTAKQFVSRLLFL
jgi:hypothetical protein